MIINELIKKAKVLAQREKIQLCQIGPSYSGVLFQSGLCGIAANLGAGNPPKLFPESEKMDLTDFLKQAASPSLLLASLGLAAINALFAGQKLPFQAGDCRDFLPYKADDTVAIVGAILPLVSFLTDKVKKIMVFEERTERRLPGFYSLEEEKELLPQCDLLLVTGSSLVNQTLDQVLKYSFNARFKALVGGTAPLEREIFKKHGFNLISGLKITDPRAMEIIAYGGASDLKIAAQKVNLVL